MLNPQYHNAGVAELVDADGCLSIKTPGADRFESGIKVGGSLYLPKDRLAGSKPASRLNKEVEWR